MSDPLPPLNDPQSTVTYRVELFPDDDPASPVPEAIRCAHVHLPDGRIFLARDFIGAGKIHRALANPRLPPGDVPVCVSEDTLCIALDWLEETLPEYAGMWARIRARVEEHFPDAP